MVILEESSAERVINEFLIPQFTPKLKGYLRTIAARGVDKVTVKFEDFNCLFLYAHLARTYQNKAWVVVDNGVRGCEVITTLKAKYVKDEPGSWREEQFLLFSMDDFERILSGRISKTSVVHLAETHGQHKQAVKTALLNEVLEYLKDDEQKAKEAFEQSADEVIKLLRSYRKGTLLF